MEKLSDEYTFEIVQDTEGGWAEEALGAEVYKKNGFLHRDNDLPAVIYVDGSKFWFRDGVDYREDDKPASEFASGTLVWYLDGMVGRADDKPAIVWADGSASWYINGKRGRTSGKPGSVYADGLKIWYDEDGEIHRDSDLPAVERVEVNDQGESIRTLAKWYTHGKIHRETRDTNGCVLPGLRTE